MSKSETNDLLKFLKPFPKEIQEKAMWLREFVWDLYPETNELIYDNYNAVAFGWSPTEKLGHVFCNIAVGRSSGNVHFGFYWGSQLTDPRKILIGQGIQYRYIGVDELKAFPKTYIKKLLEEAHVNSLSMVKDKELLRKGLTIVKSISVKKRKPGSISKIKKG